jgi:cytochrome c oxidase accessory protein FixG
MADPALQTVLESGASADAEIRRSLYATREKIYPREVHGMFARLRVSAVLVLLGLFYGIPWLSWGGQQLVLFDLPARRFHIFGLTLFPQDFLYLALLLIIAALTLFFFTALAGRLWCGYACPQTVWTEVFLWIERKVEGDRPRQMKLDHTRWGTRKVAIKGSKHAIWIAFSLWTGFTFVGFFTPVTELWSKVFSLSTGPWETFWILFYGLATYGNAGWMREQVCIYMCPYARFQSAMFDKNTLIISYDTGRGDPRGSRRRSLDHRSAGLGDCIDCTLCVQVCPTGIDIRNGLQYQCIACAACIDVCDSVMGKMGYDKGLIRYTTEHAMHQERTRIVRPRMLVYALLLIGITVAFAVSVAIRSPLALDVIRDRNALYREVAGGFVENVYTLKLINMDDQAHQFAISVSGMEGLALASSQNPVLVESGEVASMPVRVRIDPYALPASTNTIEFHMRAVDDDSMAQTEEARFLGPGPGR